MDKRKAYAIVHPVVAGQALREGHSKRIEKRFRSLLYCDGVDWFSRVEYLDYHFLPQALRSLPPGGRERMVEIAERLLVACDCGDGEISVGPDGRCAIVARRQMMASEQAALHHIPSQAAS